LYVLHIISFLVSVSSVDWTHKARRQLVQNQMIIRGLINLAMESLKGIFDQLAPSGKCHELLLYFLLFSWRSSPAWQWWWRTDCATVSRWLIPQASHNSVGSGKPELKQNIRLTVHQQLLHRLTGVLESNWSCNGQASWFPWSVVHWARTTGVTQMQLNSNYQRRINCQLELI